MWGPRTLNADDDDDDTLSLSNAAQLFIPNSYTFITF